ncbi:hypothetical protein I302_107411 [Kwoniella bestiolae CBS 10118]|uniref:HMG box domain-containing protein n=1 Tax=Kwoniella bestiolae CBS 10118 TaxID=1296100 RepID=A0A1B9FYM3_9TREE|nr:hypothetical protein I302_06849 [Kwoniella bestiolae CBS 10118]OCF23864.1 hypothetical protein I302_06849 [Kwoniella bestiolae CBS 10118]
METPWTVDGFVGTPDMIDNEGNDYFQFNPSTPKYSITPDNQFPQHSYTHPGHPMGFPTDQFQLHHPHPQPQAQATFNGFPMQGQFTLDNDHGNRMGNGNAPGELRTSHSNSSLRSFSHSHRSNSSVSSAQSQYTWSTALTNEEISSDLDADEGTNSTSISPNLLRTPNSILQEEDKRHGRVPSLSLSIDPKLFKPTPSATQVTQNIKGEEEEVEMLETAKPKSSSSSAKDKKRELLGDSPLKKGKAKKERAKKGSGSGGTSGGEGKKVSHARKQTADHIPRPRNAFILFRKHVVDSKLIPASVEMRHQNVSIITAKMWSEAPSDQKAHFNDLARIEKEEHMKKYPGYRYQPVYRRTNVIRRRVRKDEAEEQKCKSVAELLIKGKSGEDLENEIKEKIRKGSSGSSEVAAPVEAVKEAEKSNSRRASAACELSKGALRALRAQARQQSSSHESGDWSDISSLRGRSTSQPRSRSISRRQSYAFEFEDNCDSTEENDHEHEVDASVNGPNQGGMLGYGLAPSQIQGFAQHQQFHQQAGDGYEPWNELSYTSQVQFHQPQPQEYDNHFVIQQSNGNGHYESFTSLPTDNSGPGSMSFQHQQQYQTQPITSYSASFSDPSSSSTTHNFLYPQPSSGELQLPSTSNDNEFYTYDTALPFSPSVANFTFQHQQQQTDYFNMDMEYKNDTVPTSSEGIYEFTLPPSQDQGDTKNYAPMFMQANDGQGLVDKDQSGSGPLPLLPPSSGVPLENLPFDDQFVLGDFEAALAHADEPGDGNGGW